MKKHYKHYTVIGDHCWFVCYARSLRGVVDAMEREGLPLKDFHTVRRSTQEEWLKNFRSTVYETVLCYEA